MGWRSPRGDRIPVKEILQQLKTPAFIEKLLLLLATAVLSGLLVPEISSRLADTRNKQQKLFEADIQRQRDIISAQSELLKNLAKQLWEFQLSNINVSFYRISGNEAAFGTAAAKYQARSGELLGQIRAELSNARRLTSPAMHDRLTQLYFQTILPADSGVEALIARGPAATRDEWLQQHKTSFETAQKAIDDVLKDLAVEFDLAAPLAMPG